MELIRQALKAYNAYCAAEYENSPMKMKEFTAAPIGILYTTSSENEEIEIQLNYDVNKQVYILEITGLDENKTYVEKSDLKTFVNDMKSCDFQGLYDWCVETAYKEFNLEL